MDRSPDWTMLPLPQWAETLSAFLIGLGLGVSVTVTLLERLLPF
tara:strand:+ start:52 stop:183 length:132 start_codon:yes stop_codon:yes gene_type:complete